MSGSTRWLKLVDEIEHEIRRGIRGPGSKLPSLAEWRADGISQTTTLRAYRELMSRGLAVSVPGSGTYVVDVIPNGQGALTLDDHERRIQHLEERLAQLEQRT
jgi:DNA-binding GntR family transcriptional regulator